MMRGEEHMGYSTSGKSGSPASTDASSAESGTSPASRPSGETGDGGGLSELRVGDVVEVVPRFEHWGVLGIIVQKHPAITDDWYVNWIIGTKFYNHPEGDVILPTDWLKLFWRPE